jgi:bacillopeptidase F (M6 metalloprotease family)
VTPTQPLSTGDVQYATITLSDTELISHTLIWTLSNAQQWQRYSFDLTPYAGRTLTLRFGVINDGQGGQSALYVDNASLITLGPGGAKVYLPIILKNYAN